MRVIGNKGTGKSHMLAALVFYLSILRQIDPTTPRVCYIGDCHNHLNQIGTAAAVKEALSYTFYDMPDALAAIDQAPYDLAEISLVLADLKQQIIFIYDDWNYHINPKPAGSMAEKVRAGLISVALLNHSIRVEGISANMENFNVISSQDDIVNTVQCFGGVPEAEFDVFAQHLFTRLSMFQAPVERARILFFTGSVPYFMKVFDDALQSIAVLPANPTEAQQRAALDEALVRAATGDDGVEVMKKAMRQFVLLSGDDPHDKHNKLEVYTNALVGGTAPYVTCIDWRFIVHHRAGSTVSATCGLVCLAITDLIKELCGTFTELREKFNTEWAGKAVLSTNLVFADTHLRPTALRAWTPCWG